METAVNEDKLQQSLATLEQTVKGLEIEFLYQEEISKKLSEILSPIRKEGFIKEFKIRQDTLEDIFISLTGRSLRKNENLDFI